MKYARSGYSGVRCMGIDLLHTSLPCAFEQVFRHCQEIQSYFVVEAASAAAAPWVPHLHQDSMMLLNLLGLGQTKAAALAASILTVLAAQALLPCAVQAFVRDPFVECGCSLAEAEEPPGKQVQPCCYHCCCELAVACRFTELSGHFKNIQMWQGCV